MKSRTSAERAVVFLGGGVPAAVSRVDRRGLIRRTIFTAMLTAPLCGQGVQAVETNTGDGGPQQLIVEPGYALWFSTEFGLTSAQIGAVSDGDLLTDRGRRLRTNSQLTRHLGIMPVVPDIGLDALGLTPATDSLLFSCELDIFSETIGPLSHGSLLNFHGFVAATNQQLTSAFVPQPADVDAGLDAFHTDLQTGELWFSLETPLFSQALGVSLEPGDLCSSAGYIVRTNAQLLENFTILNPLPEGYGLDAVTRLPNGGLLFSVEEDFFDLRHGPVGHGDILSDSGHILVRNLDLIWPFQPFEDLGDFGLDALQVVPLPALGNATRMAP